MDSLLQILLSVYHQITSLVLDLKQLQELLVGNDVDGMMVKPDGYKVYTTSMIGNDQVKEFYLTNPWDVTTLTFQSELDVSVDFSYTNGIHIDESGSRMYVTGGKSGVQKVKQYLLNTPWDLQSAQALVLMIIWMHLVV